MKKIFIKIWEMMTDFLDSVLYGLFKGRRRDVWKIKR